MSKAQVNENKSSLSAPGWKLFFKPSIKKIILVVCLMLLPILFNLASALVLSKIIIFSTISSLYTVFIYGGLVISAICYPFSVIFVLFFGIFGVLGAYILGIVANVVYIYLLVSLFMYADYSKAKTKLIVVGLIIVIIISVLSFMLSYLLAQPVLSMFDQRDKYAGQTFYYNGNECRYGGSKDFLQCDVTVTDIQSTPILNDSNQINNLKISLIFDSQTPARAGDAAFTPCSVYTSSFHAVANGETNHIGSCDYHNAIVSDNAFSFVLTDEVVDNIIRYQLDAPYFITNPGVFYQYGVDGFTSVTYLLHMNDFLIEQNKVGGEGLDLSYTEQPYFEINDYTHDQFAR